MFLKSKMTVKKKKTFWLHCAECWILGPWPGIKPTPLALEDLESEPLDHQEKSPQMTILSFFFLSPPHDYSF